MNLHQILCSVWTFLCGNYWDDSEGCSYGQLVIGRFITTTHPLMHHISCRVKHQITQVTQPPYSPDRVPCDFWLFPKSKIIFKREEISDHWWDSGKYDGTADGNWENCLKSQGAYFKGDWGIIVLCTMFLASCIVFSKCLNFSCYMAGYLLDRTCIYISTILYLLSNLGKIYFLSTCCFLIYKIGIYLLQVTLNNTLNIKWHNV